MDHDSWDPKNPRRRTLVWSRDEAGHRQVQEVLDGQQLSGSSADAGECNSRRAVAGTRGSASNYQWAMSA